MNPVVLQHPKRTVFGAGCLKDLAADALLTVSEKILFLVATPLLKATEEMVLTLRSAGKQVDLLGYDFPGEPTFRIFDELLTESKLFEPDCVIGIGGGSVLDCAKLLAALTKSEQKVREVPGINVLKGRSIGLICVPTTSGTGSEMSPNAILLEEDSKEKKGIISPDLVPDA